MGSWNKTCSITNLPIFSGEEVVVFLLVESSYKSARGCYSSGLWNHIPLPIYGTYNDYGGIEPHPGQEWKLDAFKKCIKVVRKEPYEKDGYIRYKDLKDSPFDSFENLDNSVHGDVFEVITSMYSVPNSHGMLADMFVHKATFDELSATRGYDAAIKNLEAFIEWRKDKLAKESDDPELQYLYIDKFGLIEEFCKHIAPEEKYYFHTPGFSEITFWFGDRQGSSNGWATEKFKSDLNRNNINLSAKEMMDGHTILSLMLQLRKQFCPQGGEGSQDGIDVIHKSFIKSYNNRIGDYNAMYEEDEE